MVVNAKNSITRKALKQAIGNHLLRATVLASLFRRLKNQMNSTFEIFGFGQLLGRTQQHGGVAIMATGMHGAGMLTGIWFLGFLLDGQGIHVCAQSNALAFAIFQSGHQPMTTHIARHLIAPGLQFVANPLSR